MNVEKIRKDVNIKFIIFGALAVLLATMVACINHSSGGIFAHDLGHTAEMVRVREDNPVTFKELSRLKNAAEWSGITGYSEMISGVSNKFGIGAGGIKAVLTDAECPSVYKNEMLAGSFFDEQAVKRGEAYAVISDQLAVKLFKTIDIIGNEIEALGKKYTVTGVYKNRSPVIWSLCGDGFDRIYVPYGSIDNYGEKSVDVLTLTGKPEERMADIKGKMNMELGGKMSSYRMIDYSVSNVVFHQYFDLLLFIIGAMAILHTLIFFIKYSVNTIRRFKKKAESFYFPEMLKTDRKRGACYLSVFLLCCACIILLYKSVQFEFIIADRYIPDDNIFDIRFYAKVFMNDIMTSNSYTGSACSILEHIYKNAFIVEWIGIFLFIIFFCVAVMLLKMLVSFETNFVSMVKSGFIIIFAGGITGICVSALLGIGVCMPLKPWMTVAYYLFLRGILGVYYNETARGIEDMPQEEGI